MLEWPCASRRHLAECSYYWKLSAAGQETTQSLRVESVVPPNADFSGSSHLTMPGSPHQCFLASLASQPTDPAPSRLGVLLSHLPLTYTACYRTLLLQ